MPNYRRSTYGQTFFFTAVTYQRQRFFCLEPCIAVLRSIFRKVQAAYPIAIDTIVVLPDHLHCIWTLPGGDVNFTSRWGLIKKEFTKHVRDVIGIDNVVRTAHPTDSMLRRRDAVIWQRRFWEHQIRDDDDFAAHCDYIHYNPVKHGLAASPAAWRYSSFHKYVQKGKYDRNWGAGADIKFHEGIGNE